MASKQLGVTSVSFSFREGNLTVLRTLAISIVIMSCTEQKGVLVWATSNANPIHNYMAAFSQKGKSRFDSLIVRNTTGE